MQGGLDVSSKPDATTMAVFDAYGIPVHAMQAIVDSDDFKRQLEAFEKSFVNGEPKGKPVGFLNCSE